MQKAEEVQRKAVSLEEQDQGLTFPGGKEIKQKTVWPYHGWQTLMFVTFKKEGSLLGAAIFNYI